MALIAIVDGNPFRDHLIKFLIFFPLYYFSVLIWRSKTSPKIYKDFNFNFKNKFNDWNKFEVARFASKFIFAPVMGICCFLIVLQFYFCATLRGCDPFFNFSQYLIYLLPLVVCIYLSILFAGVFCNECGDFTHKKLISSNVVDTTPTRLDGEKDLRYNKVYKTKKVYRHSCKNEKCGNVFNRTKYY